LFILTVGASNEEMALANCTNAYSPKGPSLLRSLVSSFRLVLDNFKLELNFTRSNFPVSTLTACYKCYCS
jgi:hypothetical protein